MHFGISLGHIRMTGPSWDDHLPASEFAMNNAWNSSIKNTPFMQSFGQHPHTPVTLEINSRNPAVNAFVGTWPQQIARAKHCLATAQERQKRSADLKRQPAPEWKPGTLVLLSIKHFKLQTGMRAKLAPRFIGPFKVLECVGPANLSYRIELPSALGRMHNVFHVSSLKEFKHDKGYQPPPVPEVINGELEWEVSHISSTEGEGSTRMYQVHWVGGEITWEPEDMLTNCPELLKQFWDSKQLPCPHPIRGLESKD
jgi:hypothetical protein